MERKLASIQRIKQLKPIEGADKIELAIINGWQVVVQKGEHKEGDLVIFYEIDSFLNAGDKRYASFEDRFSNWGNKRGMRLKTIKLRKQLSQGLIMPLHKFPEVSGRYEGADVTEILKIEKWEPLENSSNSGTFVGGRKHDFPKFIRKTDEERIQNIGYLVEDELDQEFEITIKRDGSSLTVFKVESDSPYYNVARELTAKKLTFWQKVKAVFTKDERLPVYGICSRNVFLPLEGTSNFHEAAKVALYALGSNYGSFAIQGEVTAPDIQNNYEKVDAVEFHMFKLWDIDNQEYILPATRRNYASYSGVPHVEVVFSGKLRDFLNTPSNADEIVKASLLAAEGPGTNKGVMREGLVFKHMKKDFSFKAISNSYLLKTGK